MARLEVIIAYSLVMYLANFQKICYNAYIAELSLSIGLSGRKYEEKGNNGYFILNSFLLDNFFHRAIR